MENTDEEYDILYPTNMKKYVGTLRRRRNGRIGLQVVNSKFKYYGTFDRVEEANEKRKYLSIKYGLVKNIIHSYHDYLKVLCAGDKYFICDHEDMDLVENHIWFMTNTDLPESRIGGKLHKFYNLKLDFTPSGNETVYHIDGNPTNNMRSNLDIGDRRTKSIWGNSRKNNEFIQTGICYTNNKWTCFWMDDEGNRNTRGYNVSKYGYEGQKRTYLTTKML
jgi:hypothetical protein